MKTTKAITILMMLLTASVFISCSDDDNLEDNRYVVCPYTAPYPAISQAEFNKNVTSNGWKSVHTWEVLADGTLSDKDYYDDMYGTSRAHLYFDENRYTSYYYSDANNKYGFLTRDYKYNPQTNTVIQIMCDIPMFTIVSLKDNQMHVIEIIGKRSDETSIYGYTIYEKMTEKELSELRNKYTEDFNPYTD